MKVAVTGASGFVGGYLCPYLVSMGVTVVAISRKPIDYSNVYFQQLDNYCDVGRATEAIEGCSAVIHLAALTHQQGASYSDYCKINVEASLSIAAAAAHSTVKTFIYISSIKVNGEVTTTEPFRYNSIPEPADDYGVSKWVAEQELTKYCKENDLKLIIIRPPLIWGEDVKGNLKILEQAIKWRIPLPLDKIENRRDLVSIHNLVNFIHHCLLLSKLEHTTLLISDGNPITTTNIVERLAADKDINALLFKLPNFLQSMMKKRYAELYQRLFGNLEIDISATIDATQWHPSPQGESAHDD